MEPAKGDGRRLRGGGWNNNGNNSRSANRNRNDPTNHNNNVGLRPVLGQATEGSGE